MIRLKLKQFLKLHGVTAYELGKAVKGVSPKTVYMYVNGQRQPSLDGIDKLIVALRALTGENVQVGDIVAYREDGRREG